VKQIPSFLLILVAFKGIISIVGLLETPHILKGSFFIPELIINPASSYFLYFQLNYF